jgi:hypothetical protein
VYHQLNSKKRIFWNNKLSSEVWEVHTSKELDRVKSLGMIPSYLGGLGYEG